MKKYFLSEMVFGRILRGDLAAMIFHGTHGIEEGEIIEFEQFDGAASGRALAVKILSVFDANGQIEGLEYGYVLASFEYNCEF